MIAFVIRRLLQSVISEFPHGIEPHSMNCWAAEEQGDWETAEQVRSRALRALSARLPIGAAIVARSLPGRRHGSTT